MFCGCSFSSLINSWMLPVVFAISAGRFGPMEMDQRQVEEMFLTAAQSMFAVAVLANLSFTLIEATIVFLLFSTQLFFTDAEFRYYYSFFYILLAVGLVLIKKDARNGVRGLFSRAPAAPAVEKP